MSCLNSNMSPESKKKFDELMGKIRKDERDEMLSVMLSEFDGAFADFPHEDAMEIVQQGLTAMYRERDHANEKKLWRELANLLKLEDWTVEQNVRGFGLAKYFKIDLEEAGFERSQSE